VSSSFPLYRKYINNKSYFKVLSPSVFEEVQVTGRFYTEHRFEAKILPDRNFIADMIAAEGPSWEEISEEEFSDFLSECRSKRKKPV